jgi:hypothetical protein
MAVHVTGSDYECLKLCCLSSVMDGTDDMLWNVGEEDGNVSIECEECEGTDCEDGETDTDW